MEKKKVLLLGAIEHPTARQDWDALTPFAERFTSKASTRQEFLAECRSGIWDGVSIIYRTFESADLTGKFDEELVACLPASIRFICHNGAGYDQVDTWACTKRHIHVSNVPHAVDNATADAAVFLTLGALRNFAVGMQSCRLNNWRGKSLPALGHDPQGLLLGIVGMGGIGRNLARKMPVFGMRVQYHNRRVLPEAEAEGATYVGFEELLRTSDVVSLNLPLNHSTHHLISKPQFALMKPSAVLVNTARGAVVDEVALVQALAAGTIAGAGLDVFEHEPAVHEGLRAHPRVLMLPHMGTWTVETQAGMERCCISNVRQALERGTLKTRVAEQAELEY